MLSLLQQRETGAQPPEIIVRAESTRRLLKLDVSKYQEVQKVHTGGVNSLCVDNTDNRYLLSGSTDGIVCINDLHTSSGTPATTYPVVSTIGRSNKHRHKYSIETVQWYPFDTGMFVTSGMDKLLKVWDANVLKPAEEYEFTGVIYSHHMSPIASKHCLIAVGTQSAKVKLVDLKSGANTHSLYGHKGPVFTLQWSPRDEYLLASGSGDSKLMLWDVRHAKASLMTLNQYSRKTSADSNSENTAHSGRVNGLCFTSDGLHLISYGTDDKLRLWNITTGHNTNVNYGRVCNETHRCARLSTSVGCNPEAVFVPADNHIRVYDIFCGTQLKTLRGHYSQVNCCLFNQQRQELYSGANDRSILIWTPVTNAINAYESHLKEISEKGSNRIGKFVKRINADNWSSDED